MNWFCFSEQKTGLFNPSQTVAYLGNSLPSSVNRDTFVRGSERTSSRRKLCPEMISGPQNDLKHTGHVGLDGAYFGDVAFLSSSSNSQSVRNPLLFFSFVFFFLLYVLSFQWNVNVHIIKFALVSHLHSTHAN